MQVKTSAGLLMFRRNRDTIEVLIVHPGGPFFHNKDVGAWTIPKGEAGVSEDLLGRARIEFDEEVGLTATGPWIDLGSVRQAGGKTVHAWAFEGALPPGSVPVSNTFEIEWPPRSGQRKTYPEVDQVRFFPIEEARQRINVAQRVFLDRLMERLTAQPDGDD
jgi:predicted NUDIX family NTP pyrophosphohydrolase